MPRLSQIELRCTPLPHMAVLSEKLDLSPSGEEAMNQLARVRVRKQYIASTSRMIISLPALLTHLHLAPPHGASTSLPVSTYRKHTQ